MKIVIGIVLMALGILLVELHKRGRKYKRGYLDNKSNLFIDTDTYRPADGLYGVNFKGTNKIKWELYCESGVVLSIKEYDIYGSLLEEWSRNNGVDEIRKTYYDGIHVKEVIIGKSVNNSFIIERVNRYRLSGSLEAECTYYSSSGNINVITTYHPNGRIEGIARYRDDDTGKPVYSERYDANGNKLV